MKELSTEQKAKRYDEAIERAKNFIENGDERERTIAESIFAGIMEESDDEKIRKALLRFHKSTIDVDGIKGEDVIAWLEKQSEQSKWKPSKDEMDALYGLAYITNKMDDKKDEAVTKLYQDLKREFFNGASYENMFPSSPVNSDINIKKQGEQKTADNEPKFKVGDWVFIEEIKGYKNGPFQIKAVDSFGYNFDEYHIIPFMYEDLLSKWTIQDAKDGDVLASHECLVLFKEIDGLNIRCYCTYHYMGFNPSFHINTLQNKTAFQPATKEQRDTLEKAMANDIEYIRKDAFIEKACEYLMEYEFNDSPTIVDRRKRVENFKKYMED